MTDRRRILLGAFGDPGHAFPVIALGAEVAVESGAGEKAGVTDEDYQAAGAGVAGRAAALKGAGIILCVAGPDPATLKGADKGALLVGGLDPSRREADIAAYAKAGLDPLAMERMPPMMTPT